MPAKLGDEANPGALRLGTHAAPAQAVGSPGIFGGGATSANKTRRRRIEQAVGRAVPVVNPRLPPRKFPPEE